MFFPTHISFALLTGLLVLKYFNLKTSSGNAFIFLAIIILASLIPDVDESKSFLGKHVKIIGWIFKHRGIFHSIILAVFFSIIIFGITQNHYYAFAFILGFVSHLVLDAMTHSGITPFWPSKAKIKGFVKSGGIIDVFLLIIFLLLCLILILNIV